MALELLLAAAAAGALPAAPASGAQRIAAEIIASTADPRPGSTMLVGFRMTPHAGWHGYWSNPGESGLAPTVQWTAPAGMHFGPLQHPAPTLLQSMGLVSYVHSGTHMLVSRVRLDRSIARGAPLTLQADLRWAACSDKLCVPEHATLSLHLVAGVGKPSAAAPLLAQALAREPRPIGGGSYSVENGKLVLQLPAAARLSATSVRFFPDSNGYFDALGARTIAGREIRISSPLKGDPPKLVTGVAADGARAYRLSFHRGSASNETAAATRKEKEAMPAAEPRERAATPDPEVSDAGRSPPPPPLTEDELQRALVLLGLAGFAVAAFALARRPYR